MSDVIAPSLGSKPTFRFSTDRPASFLRSIANHAFKDSAAQRADVPSRTRQNPFESGPGARFESGIEGWGRAVENIFEKKVKKVLHGNGVLVISLSRYGEPSGAQGREARWKTERQLTVWIEAIYCSTT